MKLASALIRTFPSSCCSQPIKLDASLSQAVQSNIPSVETQVFLAMAENSSPRKIQSRKQLPVRDGCCISQSLNCGLSMQKWKHSYVVFNSPRQLENI
jgi:hypothetical protein